MTAEQFIRRNLKKCLDSSARFRRLEARTTEPVLREDFRSQAVIYEILAADMREILESTEDIKKARRCANTDELRG